MARAAVNAKAKAKQQATQPQRRQPQRHGRRRHASGGNPNQQLFFMRLRRQAKWVYVLLAVLFALTFAFLGVGSGQGSGLDQLFNGLNIFHSGGNAVSKAQKEVQKHPTDPKGYRDLATAYEAKGDAAGAITALQGLTRLKAKDAAAWSELAGLQMSQAQTYLSAYQAAYQNRQLAAPSSAFTPTSGKVATILGTNRVEQVAAQRIDTQVQNLQSQTQLAFNNAVSSYDQVTQITPKDANAWFQLAQAAQQAGSYTQAVTAYKRYLVLDPTSPNKGQILQLIKQLAPTTTTPSSGSKKK
jgi:Flp pilus assembly protein TadD